MDLTAVEGDSADQEMPPFLFTFLITTCSDSALQLESKHSWSLVNRPCLY